MSYGPKFNVGDIVILKSGGPKMTVDQYYSEPLGGELTSQVLCKWFDNKDNIQQDWFEEGALEKANS